VRALIIGSGRVGSAVAKRMRASDWDVVVIDETEEALGRLGENWPGEFQVGHGMDTEVLERLEAPLILLDQNDLVVQPPERTGHVRPDLATTDDQDEH